MFEIGNSLREARHRQQLELSEVEQATKIRSRYLKALEEEAFDSLPAQTYVKGFLRTYADYLGLDGQLYVDEYNSRYSAGGEEPRQPVVARRTAHIATHRRLERRGVLIALAGIGILVGLFFAAFNFGGQDNTGSRIPNLGPSTPKAHAKTKTQTHKAVVRPARPAKFRFFVVSNSGNCWMEVRNYSVNGRTLYAGTLQLHQYQRFVARRLWIDFGSPGNVKASVNGQAVTIPGGGRTVTVQVTRNGIFPAPKTG